MRQSAHIKTILAVCIGPLLLAPTVSAKSLAFKPARQKFLDHNDNAGEQIDAFDFGTCAFNTFMCCWSNRVGEEPVSDNTVRCDTRHTAVFMHGWYIVPRASHTP